MCSSDLKKVNIRPFLKKDFQPSEPKLSFCESPQIMTKETIAILCSLTEVCKIIKFRGEDIVSTDKLLTTPDILETIPIQTIDDIITSIKRKEAKRASLELQSLNSIEGMILVNDEIKRNIIRIIKRVMGEFERRYFLKEPKNASLVGQLNSVMEDYGGKIQIVINSGLGIILNEEFRKQRISPAHICQVCLLYTKLLLQKRLKKTKGVVVQSAAT